MEAVCVLFGIGFFVVAVGIAISVGIATNQKANETWQAAARELGLRFEPGTWLGGRKIQGQYRGQWVKVDVHSTGGKNSQTFTRYQVFYPEPLGLGLRLNRQGFFSNLWQMLGGQDIQVGDGEFDADVVVKGRDPQEVIRFLTPARRARVHRLLLDLQACIIDDDKIHWQKAGLETDRTQLIATVERLCQVARSLTARPEDEPSAEVPEVLPAPVARPAPGPPPLPPPAEVPEVVPVRPYYEMPLPSEPPPLPAPAQPEPGPPIPAERETILPPPLPPAIPEPPPVPLPSSPVATPPTPRSPEAAPAAPATGREWGPSAAEVCDRLFKGEPMTQRVTEQFDQNYKDRPVRWSGVLREVNLFFFDAQFGNQTGTRATFEVHEVAGLFGSNKVQAVVQLPRELESELRGRIGERLTFSGRLVGCDAFLRRLFVAGGQLS
jgi:hypothetical protein